MSVSVRVARRGRLFRRGAVLFLTAGASVTASLSVMSIAASGLATLATNRPGVLDDWREPPFQKDAALRAAQRGAALASLFAEYDAAFGASDVAGLGDRLAALGAKLRGAEPMVVASGNASTVASATPRSERAAVPTPRVIAIPDEVELAGSIPQPSVIRLASLEDTPQPSPGGAPAEVSAAPADVSAEAAPAPVVPLPPLRPADLTRMAQVRELARSPASPLRLDAAAPAPRPARPIALAYAPSPEAEGGRGAGDFLRNLLSPGDVARPLGGHGGVAVYDIESATVRLPDGERLEAHSGLGHRQDDASYVREKNRGPTPPNIYDLRMREARFHGAEAIRLLPRDQKKVFNRDGLLAHPYMYVGGGDRSQSNGCVVFRNYDRFLRAFKAGQIARLIVVPSMRELPTYLAAL
ncbi:DUF2778 domain-containing protein [Hansschlegelia plantiphila]|uniref:Tlde1 domain-containing protein n=1 Tax=Hansschlegelia plantiphila TaxID=374655 RepID=A0A9W6MX34_9HYPH|nr:DUF2778 domain-containing protein [Hansschlegelia plantiphila]GLK69462.1 hypothetical protein GCM10008179_31000 [Hansschlegelia plantiphila]